MDSKTQSSTLAVIRDNEAELMRAMLKSDTAKLDELIADELIFTDHTGNVFGKEDDLRAHREEIISIDSIETEGSQIRLFENTAIVSVLKDTKGTFMKEPFSGRLQFTRVWHKREGNWQVVAGHSSAVS